MVEEVIHLMKHIDEMETYEVVAAIKRAQEYKYQITDYMDLMILWFRDVLMYKASMDANSLLFKEEIVTIRNQAADTSYNGIEQILQAIDKAKNRIKANVNLDIVIEMMFLTIRDYI